MIVSRLLLTANATASCAELGRDDDLDDATPLATVNTCDPRLAAGAVPAFHRALLDTIATTCAHACAIAALGQPDTCN